MTTKIQPQYAVVANTLIRDIARGTHPVGSLLPAELELAQRFGVSRNTMRSALRMLVDMGLVSRRAGMGTLVQARSAEPNYVQAVESLHQLFPDWRNTEQLVLGSRDVVADEDVARLTAGAVGEAWIRFDTVRRLRRRHTPVSWSFVYVAPAFRAVGSKLHHLREPSYSVFEPVFGRRVAEVVQQSDAVYLPADVAVTLGVEAGSPGLRVARRFLGEDGRMLMVTDSYSPPGREGFTIRLRANWPNRGGVAGRGARGV